MSKAKSQAFLPPTEWKACVWTRSLSASYICHSLRSTQLEHPHFLPQSINCGSKCEPHDPPLLGHYGDEVGGELESLILPLLQVGCVAFHTTTCLCGWISLCKIHEEERKKWHWSERLADVIGRVAVPFKVSIKINQEDKTYVWLTSWRIVFLSNHHCAFGTWRLSYN